MKKPDKYGDRLNTKNFRNVDLSGVFSIDYDEKHKILEIEDTTGEVCQFENANKSEWNAFIECLNKEKDLAVCIKDFKKKYDSPYYYYYRLVIPSHQEV
jgi:hypothetical protein